VTSKNVSNTFVISDIERNKDKLVSGSLHGKSNFKFKIYFPHISLQGSSNCRKCFLFKWKLQQTNALVVLLLFFSFGSTAPPQALAASMKLSVSLKFLDLEQSVGLLERVSSSSQVLHLYTNRKTHTQYKQ
jgi:hypothetical protein